MSATMAIPLWTGSSTTECYSEQRKECIRQSNTVMYSTYVQVSAYTCIMNAQERHQILNIKASGNNRENTDTANLIKHLGSWKHDVQECMHIQIHTSPTPTRTRPLYVLLTFTKAARSETNLLLNSEAGWLVPCRTKSGK